MLGNGRVRNSDDLAVLGGGDNTKTGWLRSGCHVPVERNCLPCLMAPPGYGQRSRHLNGIPISELRPLLREGPPVDFCAGFQDDCRLRQNVPRKSDVVPSVAWPATCQKMLALWAPPFKWTIAPEPRSRVPAIWKIHTAFGPPERVTSLGMMTPDDHLYRPGAIVLPAILPAPNSVAVGFVLPAASVYAVCMSPIAVPRFAGRRIGVVRGVYLAGHERRLGKFA